MNPVKSNGVQRSYNVVVQIVTVSQQETVVCGWLCGQTNMENAIVKCKRMLTENEKGMFEQTQDSVTVIGLRS